MDRIIVLLSCVSWISAAYLDIIPGTSVKEGDKVTIRCAEVFAYGFEMSSKITLQHNSSGLTQEATWKLLMNEIEYNHRWRLPRTVNKTVDADIVFTMIYEFKASIQHNKMQFRCFSSRTSETAALRKLLFVRKTPSVLNCVIKPPFAHQQGNTIRCWIVLGSPMAKQIDLTGRQLTMLKQKRREYATNTRYSYTVGLFSWIIIAKQFNEPTPFKIILKNDIGNTTSYYRLDVIKKKTKVVKKVIVKDPTAKLEIEPNHEVPLHVEDFIRCRIVNSTRKWRVRIMLKTERNLNDTEVSAGENVTDYMIPKSTAVQRFIRFNCLASSNGTKERRSQSVQKWVYPKNHRTFLRFDEDKSVFLIGSTAAATCHFLPRAGQTSAMNVSIVTRDNRVLMKSSYNGTGAAVIAVDNLGERFQSPKCTNNMNLWVCAFKLMNLISSDRGFKLRCETQTSRRMDMLEKVIQVQMPPTIGMLTPTQIIGNENDTVKATCLISLGYPPADTRSLKFANTDGLVDSKNEPPIKDISEFKWVVLRVTKRLMFADQGTNLTCSASNDIGVAKAVSQIIMHLPTYNLSVTPSPHATLRRNQTLKCAAYGYPVPDIIFTGKIRNQPFQVTSEYRNDYYRSVSGFVSLFQDDDFTMNCTAVNVIKGRKYFKTKEVRYKPTSRIIS